MKTVIRISLMLAFILAGFVGFNPRPTEAATFTSISFALTTNNGTCLNSEFLIDFAWVATTNDAGGFSDFVGMIAYDGNGVAIAADWNGVSPPTPYTQHTIFGPGNQINAMTARPLTIEVYDITSLPPAGSNTQAVYDNILGQNAPLLGAAKVDQANAMADCSSLPYVTTPPPPAPLVTTSLAVPQIGMVQISANQSQPAYDSAGGSVIRLNNGSELRLPNDADQNGFDTYVVTEVVQVEGVIWVGLFLGNRQWVYVPLSGVTPVAGSLAP